MQFTLGWSNMLYRDTEMRVMKQRTDHFTLVEILMVTGMICLIAALIAVAYNGVYRSWATRNTIATMKAAHLALDKYMLENGAYPTSSKKTLQDVVKDVTGNDSKLVNDLLQNCAPYSQKDGNSVKIFDDFGDKDNPHHIYYVFPAANTASFALLSAGKDGNPGTDDDIIYLPAGCTSPNLKPGFYMGVTTASGGISDYEPLAQ